MSAATDFAELYRLRPQEAMDYLRDRHQLTVTHDWRDLRQGEHVHQFTVSRLTALDVLGAVRQGIVDSVGGDLSRRDWTRDMADYLARKGWWGEREVLDPKTGRTVTTVFDPARLKLIYDTNTRMAHAAGQWERIERRRDSHPYIRYITQRDEKVREEHARWDNVTLPVDDAFWDAHLPPNGFNCRCRVTPVSRRDYDRGTTPTGQPMIKSAPPDNARTWTNARTGETLTVPEGVQPGFAYNVGRARQARPLNQEQSSLAPAPTGVAPQAVAPSAAPTAIEATQASSAPQSTADTAERARLAHLTRLAREKLTNADPDLAAQAVALLAADPGFASWFANPLGNWPLVVIPAIDAAAIGALTRVGVLSGNTAAKQRREHPELTPAEYAQAQAVVDSHTHRGVEHNSGTGTHSLIYVREVEDEQSGGHVLVVKATVSGEGLFVTSYRRLSRDEALREREIARLLRRAQKK
ncbi:MAG TPA: phage minor head protein [Rhodocyclaceae bacterium]|nr:phage minor head protein [Rhodocyclaceae bacterium]